MSEQDNQLQPFDTAQGKPRMPENPTPQDFGFPENPDLSQVNAWRNQERFLQELAKCGHKIRSAEAAGVTIYVVEAWDFRDMYGFKKRYQAAKAKLLERYEESCDEDALIGVEKPVISNGKVVLNPDGTICTYRERDKLTRMFRMKKLDPSYKDNYQPQTVQDNRSVTIINNFPSGPRQLTTNQGAVVEGQSREITEEDKS